MVMTAQTTDEGTLRTERLPVAGDRGDGRTVLLPSGRSISEAGYNAR